MATDRLLAASYAPWGAQTRESNIAEHMVTMSGSALFAGLSKEELLEIASRASVKSFAPNEVLLMQGQPARHLMVIQSGSVKVCQLSNSGNEVILWMAGRGDAVGVLIEALSQTYTSTAHAMTPCAVLDWECTRLHSIVAKIPQMRRNITQILSTRLEELQERFREVATEKVAPRVAKAIMRLLKQVGTPASGGIEISLSREELAQMTGTTLFTISRLIAKWGEEGFVLPRREAIVVLNARRLEELSNEDDQGQYRSVQPASPESLVRQPAGRPKELLQIQGLLKPSHLYAG